MLGKNRPLLIYASVAALFAAAVIAGLFITLANKGGNTQNIYEHITGMTFSAGDAAAYAILDDGSLWAWGNNFEGQIGDGTTTRHALPVKVMDGVAAVSAGKYHVMAVKHDGTLWAWGGNNFGQLGNGSSTPQFAPLLIMDDVIAVSSGDAHTLAVRGDGTLWAWGGNERGQLGDGTFTDKHSPVMIRADVTAISAGGSHSMAVCGGGVLYAWGGNASGQIGDGTQNDSSVPVSVKEDIAVISAGGSHSFAVTNGGILWAWGSNLNGRLGNGTSAPSSVPLRIMDNVITVSAGRDHSTAIDRHGALWTWGSNWGGQLGDGGTADSPRPVLVMQNAAAVSAGHDFTIALRGNGSLWAWGLNHHGRLGDGSVTERHTPVKVLDSVKICSKAASLVFPDLNGREVIVATDAVRLFVDTRGILTPSDTMAVLEQLRMIEANYNMLFRFIEFNTREFTEYSENGRIDIYHTLYNYDYLVTSGLINPASGVHFLVDGNQDIVLENVLLFNKDIKTELNFTCFYDMVWNKTWTVSNFELILSLTAALSNGRVTPFMDDGGRGIFAQGSALFIASEYSFLRQLTRQEVPNSHLTGLLPFPTDESATGYAAAFRHPCQWFIASAVNDDAIEIILAAMKDRMSLRNIAENELNFALQDMESASVLEMLLEPQRRVIK